MVELEEFCCGCSLRTGVLIISWSTMIWDGIRVMFYLAKLIYDPSYAYVYEETPVATILRDFVFLTACMAGIFICALGFYGMYKNRPDFLKLFYYYYLGYTAYWILMALVSLIFPSMRFDLSILSPFHLFSKYGTQMSIVFFIGYFFLAAFTYYIAVVIKNYIDYVKTNDGNNLDPENMANPILTRRSPSL